LQAALGDLKFDNAEDFQVFMHTSMPSLLSSLTSGMASATAAFKAGKISNSEYRAELLKTAEAIRDTRSELEKKDDALKNEETSKEEAEGGWENDDLADNLDNAINTLKAFDTIADTIEENYSALEKLFNNNWELKIDTSELETMRPTIESIVSDFRSDF
jgi:hypothetical protein